MCIVCRICISLTCLNNKVRMILQHKDDVLPRDLCRPVSCSSHTHFSDMSGVSEDVGVRVGRRYRERDLVVRPLAPTAQQRCVVFPRNTIWRVERKRARIVLHYGSDISLHIRNVGPSLYHNSIEKVLNFVYNLL